MIELLKHHNRKLNCPGTKKENRIYFTSFTCPFKCKGYYNEETRNSYKKNVPQYRDEHKKLTEGTLYPDLLCEEIEKKKPVWVRFHVEGEFYSLEYAEKIRKVVSEFPNVKFFTYSKQMEIVKKSGLLKLHNINIINSIMPDGTFNFTDDMEVLEKWIKKGWILCPASKDKKITCNRCFLCWNNNKVIFKYHGVKKLKNRAEKW